MDGWTPGNDVERGMLEARDLAEILGILATAPLFLPGFADPHRVLTRERDGAPYLLVFTSVAGLERTVRAEGWRQTSLAELVRAWPEGHGLAVNPATPIGVLVTPDQVPGLLPNPVSFAPANEVEHLIREALLRPDGDVLLDVLVTARVIVPTRAVEVDGVWTVPVFTSTERWADFVDATGLSPATVTLDLVAVLQRWPDPTYRLAVNLGSTIGFTVGGERVPGLLAHAAALAQRGRS